MLWTAGIDKARALNEQPLGLHRRRRTARPLRCKILEAVGPIAGFLDDTKAVGEIVNGHPVLAGFEKIRDPMFVRDHMWFVAIGDNAPRSKVFRELADRGAEFVNVIHSTAFVSRTAVLGRGVFVGNLTVVNPNSIIGDCAVLDGHTRVGMDIRIGEGAFLGPGVIIAGGVSIGARTFLGAGVTVSNEVTIGADCVVGAHSLVLRDLPDGSAAYGTPARPAPLNRQPATSRLHEARTIDGVTQSSSILHALERSEQPRY